MISDVLCEAVNELDLYLGDPLYADTYHGELRGRIVEVRNSMERLRLTRGLDLSPDAAPNHEGSLGFRLPPVYPPDEPNF